MLTGAGRAAGGRMPGLIHGFAAFLGVVDAAEASVGSVLALLSRIMRS